MRACLPFHSVFIDCRLKAQIPDIRGTLETVRHLRENNAETLNTHFMLADNLYVKAKVPPTDKVALWLGVSTQQTW